MQRILVGIALLLGGSLFRSMTIRYCAKSFLINGHPPTNVDCVGPYVQRLGDFTRAINKFYLTSDFAFCKAHSNHDGRAKHNQEDRSEGNTLLTCSRDRKETNSRAKLRNGASGEE